MELTKLQQEALEVLELIEDTVDIYISISRRKVKRLP